MNIDISSKNSGTSYSIFGYKKPIAYFTMPSFGFMEKTVIPFYTLEEANKFVRKLPKDWLVECLIPTIKERL